MGFIAPQMLWLLLLVIPVIVVWSLLSGSGNSRLARFISPVNHPLLAGTISRNGRFHRGLLLILALTFSIAAAARPYWGEQERVVQQAGINLLLALDVSNSMLARDIPTTVVSSRVTDLPSRLDYAKSIMRDITLEMTGHRIGIIPFAGEAFLQTPLTTDHRMVLSSISDLRTDTVGRQGTEIPEAIRVAIDAFERSGPGSRVLIVITDGEDHSDAINRAAQQAADAGILVFALGIGSREGAPIPIDAEGRLKEAADGTKVVTRVNEAILRDLVAPSGGMSLFSPTGRMNLQPLLANLRALERGDFGEDIRVVRQERFQWFLALALFCLFLEPMIRERRGPLPTAGRKVAP